MSSTITVAQLPLGGSQEMLPNCMNSKSECWLKGKKVYFPAVWSDCILPTLVMH